MSTPDVTVASETPTPKPAGLSLQDKVRAARAAAQNRKTKDFEIPGFDGTVWGTFKALDKWSDVKGIVAKYTHLDEDEAEVMVAADSVLKSCVTLYGLDGGQRAPLNMSLGREFAEWVEEGSTVAGMTDLQAVFVAVPNEVQLVMLYTQLDQWFAGVGVKTDEAQVGNSVAPS